MDADYEKCLIVVLKLFLRYGCFKHRVKDPVEKIPGPNSTHCSQHFFYKSVKVETSANDHDIPNQHEQTKEKPAPSKRQICLLLLGNTISSILCLCNFYFVFSAFNTFLTDEQVVEGEKKAVARGIEAGPGAAPLVAGPPGGQVGRLAHPSGLLQPGKSYSRTQIPNHMAHCQPYSFANTFSVEVPGPWLDKVVQGHQGKSPTPGPFHKILVKWIVHICEEVLSRFFCATVEEHAYVGNAERVEQRPSGGDQLVHV